MEHWNNIGPVVTAEVAVNTSGGANNAWLCVGGVGGLAVLTLPNGNGWSASAGLGPNFSGLVAGMSFNLVGNYSYVRKLICENNLLYVLTDKQLDVVDLGATNFANGTLTVITLATLPEIGLQAADTLIDFIVSGKFALLSTSQGLFRVGNNKNIGSAISTADVAWTPVPLPESVGPATQLFPITFTGRSQDFAMDGGSNVYVLNAYVGSNLAQLARYTVADASSTNVNELTVQQVVNYYNKFAVQAPLVFYDSYKDQFATDGASFFNGRSKNLATPPYVNLAVGMLRGSFANNLSTYPVPLNISTAFHLTTIVKNFASGSWLMAGDFGLRVNE